jgi:hypothetical protein
MLGFLAGALLVASNTAVATGTCSGADPAISGANVKSVTNVSGVNNYVVGVSVTNRGNAGQPSNVLQSVDVFQNGNKVDTKGIPPLAAGQLYHFNFSFTRSAGAADGTTRLKFAIAMHQPSGAPNSQDCDTGNDSLIRSF